jgi:hypothetical protein
MLTSFSATRAWSATVLALLLGLSAAGRAQADSYDDAADPPNRVARLSYLGGQVSFQPSGDGNWVQASINRPLVTGDALYADRGSRAELEIGGAAVRLDDRTSMSVLNLDDRIAQFQLSEGTANLSVRNVGQGGSYEVDTPTLAFVVTMPGEYRIDIAPDGNSTMITVFNGGGDVYGENNASYSVRAGNSYRFNDSALRDYEILDLPRPDDFDNWVQSRQRQYSRSVSSRYVADDMIGVADLDSAGRWSTDAQYGEVWYPTSVAVDYVPYRDGHWSWIDPWGWTWVDNAAWGFAPFHYGRWVYVSNRWGWCPGPRHVRAVYTPAMVAFVGGVSIGVGGPVGWFPLGPRDVYVPWYRASRGYFNTVNVRNTTIINNTYITNVYNDYSRGRPVNGNYMWRGNAAALTAVSRDTFVGARPVMAGRVNVNAAQWRNAPVQSRLGIAPTQASFVAADARRATAMPQQAALDRRVIARSAPPPAAMPIASRVQAIERNNAQPLSRPGAQGRFAAPDGSAAAAQRGAPSRVQVVGADAGKPQPITRGNAGMDRRPGGPAQNGNPRGNADAGAPRNGGNDRGMPSSRFAPHGGAATTAPQTAPADNARPGFRNRATEQTTQPQDQPRGNPQQGFRNRAVEPTPQPRDDAQRGYRGRSAEPAVQPQPQRDDERSGFRNRATPTVQPQEQPRANPQQGFATAPSNKRRSRDDDQRNFRGRNAEPTVQPRAVQVQPQPQPQRDESRGGGGFRNRAVEQQPAMQQPRAPQPAEQPRAQPQREMRQAPQQNAPERRGPPERNKDKDGDDRH